MKNFLRFLLITFLLTFFSCKKSSNNTSQNSPTLNLVRNEWTGVSRRVFLQNGSNYTIWTPLYQVFTSDNLRIMKNNHLDTQSDISKYKLLKDDSTILFYHIHYGEQDGIPDTCHIRSINDSLFVYYMKVDTTLVVVDSLKR